MEDLPADILYLLYQKLDINSAKQFSQTCKVVRECVPKYMITHKNNFINCLWQINEIEYTTGLTDLYFRGDKMIGTCMFGICDGNISKDKTNYSIRNINNKKIMYLYYSKLVKWMGNIYTWEGLNLLSPIEIKGYNIVPGIWNKEIYSKLLNSDGNHYNNCTYKYASRVLRITDNIYEFYYYPKN
ncbi:hypothetical protein PV-S19_0094 [Pacmanvirus S19]|nr:hypothetical protein PV-S19_0094 [Pacmanvirus S19]